MKGNNIKLKLRSTISTELRSINFKCVIIGAVIILIGGFLSAFAAGSTESYRELNRPSFAPPAVIFPIVWTVLYILIGGAAGAVACACSKAFESDKYKGLLFFIIMIVFNYVWSPLFFGAGAYFAAFVAVIMMIILTFFTIIFFGRIYKISAFIMAAYLLWLFFAAYLNLAIIILN